MKWDHKISIGVMVFMVGCSPGPSLRSVLEESDIQIRLERAEVALQQLQEARVDHPENMALLFAIACAQQASAESALETGRAEVAEKQFRKSMESFMRVDEAPGDDYGIHARFNAATVGILLDQSMVDDARYLERVENLEASIALFQGVLTDAPYLREAQSNLNHARYQLCLLRQRPPDSNAEEEEKPEEEPPPEASVSVDSATTQIPNARAEVLDDGTIMLHLPPREEATP